MSIGQVIVLALELVAGHPILTVALSLLVASLYLAYSIIGGGSGGKNPLQDDSRRSPEPFVHDTRRRDAILKDKYKHDKVPDNLDAIIIGSGAGGLSAATLLAKTGQRVLVLEQHDQAGGCCHSFVEKGFEFDTGIHYIGGMQDGKITRVLLDQLTCGQLRWARMDEVFDTVVLGKPPNAKRYPMIAGKGEYYENLIKMFPQDRAAISGYKDLIKDAGGSFSGLVVLKVLPRWLTRIVVATGVYRLFLKAYRKQYDTRTLQEVLDGLTDNQELKTVLSYICGDYGVSPENTPFMLHAVLIDHYLSGAYYPANGSSEIAFHMIKVIQQAGGRVLVQAPVTNIVCDSSGRAVGVRVAKGEEEIRARNIISDAGVVNTFTKLLPQTVARNSEIYPMIKQVGQSYAFLTAFIGLEGSPSELKLPAGNFWFYDSKNINETLTNYLNTLPENIESSDVPYGFISFPAAKDPEWDQKFPGKSSAIVVTMAKWEWFEEWNEEKVRHRGDRYEGIKDVLGRKMWEQCVDIFPQIDGKKVYMEVGTPVTNNYYMACPRGEMYGLDHSVSRFSPEAVSKLRTDTDIAGLHLTGQDTLSCGFLPAVLTGLLCASKILGRNVMMDLIKLSRKIRKSHSATNGHILKKDS